MNYRHAYHAGNFADVVKHAIFCRVLVHLRDKPAAFRVIDTHAGAGRYDLTGPEAEKTKEWQSGIGRVLAAEFSPDVAALLAPYLQAVKALNSGSAIAAYPGSPKLAQALLRRQDRLIACEMERNAATALQHNLRGDSRCKAISIDGWTALTAYVPPTERRGVVLIDPPFEQPDEFMRLADGLVAAHRKWPTGSYLLWYPIKDDVEVAGFVRRLTRSSIAKMLRAELIIPSGDSSSALDMGLRGSGLVAINPPWTLYRELEVLLPALAKAMSRGAAQGTTLHWLTGESSP